MRRLDIFIIHRTKATHIAPSDNLVILALNPFTPPITVHLYDVHMKDVFSCPNYTTVQAKKNTAVRCGV